VGHSQVVGRSGVTRAITPRSRTHRSNTTRSESETSTMRTRFGMRCCPANTRKLRSDTRHDTRTLGHPRPPNNLTMSAGRLPTQAEPGTHAHRQVVGHSAIAVNVRAPAGTAQTSIAGTVTRSCRTPRRALGSSTAPNALADRRAPGQNQRPPDRNGQRRQRSAKINKRTRRSLQ
jgi:hypothetical protein